MNILKPAMAGTLESSDAQVTLEPGEGLSIDIRSSVLAQYGRQIRACVEETLKRLEDKEQVELVTEAIEAITMPDEPAAGKAEVLRKAAQYQVELEAERAAEAAEAEAEGGDTDAPTAVAPMKVPFRRTK